MREVTSPQGNSIGANTDRPIKSATITSNPPTNPEIKINPSGDGEGILWDVKDPSANLTGD